MGRAMGGYAVRPLLRMPDKTSSPAASRRQLLQGVAPEVRPHPGASLAVAVVGAAVAVEVRLGRVRLQAVVGAAPAAVVAAAAAAAGLQVVVPILVRLACPTLTARSAKPSALCVIETREQSVFRRDHDSPVSSYADQFICFNEVMNRGSACWTTLSKKCLLGAEAVT